MKKNITMMLVIAAAGFTALNAEDTQAQCVTASSTQKTAEVAAKLSVDEQSFVAKLNDQNRKIFSDKFSADQRKAAMLAVKNGANADEVIQRMIAAKELKESSAIVNADATTSATK